MTVPENATPPETGFLQHWGVLIVMALASFVLVLDTTMMNVAISAIVADLGTTVQGIQGAIALYATIMAAFTLAGGKLGDAFGMKRVFSIGILCYGVGTLTAALTPNLWILVLGWSVVEGVGAALMLPMTLTLLALKYRGQERALGFGVIGGMQAFGAAVGPIFGGFMASQLSWRWAFGSEAAIVAVILALLYLLPESERQRQVQVDWGGIALSALGLSTLAVGTILSGSYGWVVAKRPLVLGDLAIAPFGLSVVPFLLAVGAGLLVAFFRWQQARERQGKTPLLRTGLLDNRPFLAGVTAGGLLNVVLAGGLFTLPVFLQGGLGFDPLASGVALLPLSLGVLALSLTTSGLGQRFSPKQVIWFGLAVLAAGAWALRGAVAEAATSSDLAPGLLLLGAGTGLVLAQITNVTLAAVQPEESGEASGLNLSARQLGTAFGTAIAGAVLLTVLLSNIARDYLPPTADRPTRRAAIVALEDAAQRLSPEERQAFLATLPEPEAQRLAASVDRAWRQSQQAALTMMVIFAAICAIAVGFL